MTPELFIQTKAAEAIKNIYGADVEPSTLQIQVTRKEFEGDYTLVTFPLLRISHSSPENTGNAIGEWLKANVSEIAGYNSVKGFLNILFSPLYWNELFAEIAGSGDFGTLPQTGTFRLPERTSWWSSLPRIRINLFTSDTSETTFSVILFPDF